MAAVLVFFIVSIIAIKTFSYGAWELKRENKAGGVFAMVLAFLNVFLATRYLINYWT